MMKRFIILTCLSVLSAYITSAQETSTTSSSGYQKVRLGIKVAPSMVWLKANSKFLSGNGAKIGFSYGMMLDIHFSKNYAIGTGLDVCYRGGSVKVSYPFGLTNAAVYNLQYLQLPFTLKLKTNEIGYMTYFGQVGLETGFNIRARGTDLEDNSGGNKENIRGQIVPVNLALLIHAGAEYSLGGHTSIMAGIYFSNGFVDVLETKDPLVGGLNARSNGLGLNLGLFF